MNKLLVIMANRKILIVVNRCGGIGAKVMIARVVARVMDARV